MSLIEVIEHAHSSRLKRAVYAFVLTLGFGLVFITTAARYFGLGTGSQPRPLVDFDAFFIVGQAVWAGDIEKAYYFATMSRMQETFGGTQVFFPWTYPPQFDLLVAPLSLLPLGVAYSLFVGATMAAYLATLRKIAAENLLSVLILLSPVFVVTIAGGQNGFISGTLIGLTCLGLQRRRNWAGLSLGLMVVKPHLAIAFATYVLVGRRWGVAAVAAATVGVTSALVTVLLGPGVWQAFLGGAREAQIFLVSGFYPMFRMISVYAAVRTLGFPSSVAGAAQVLMAVLALSLVWRASRSLPVAQGLGVTAIATLLISPYAYDYDLPILGIGLALLLPDLRRLGSGYERGTLYALALVAGAWGLAQNARLSAVATSVDPGAELHLSVAGAAVAALFGLCWHILRHQSKEAEPRIGRVA